MANLAKPELRLVAQELGLIESTNSRQARNGTMAFIDPVCSTSKCITSYTVHTNGYVRRKFTWANPTWYRNVEQYQLNRTRKTTRKSTYNGREYTMTERIMATPLEQVAILFKSTINYRKNK